MEPQTQTLIQEQLKKLPPSLKQAIEESRWEQSTDAILRTLGLTPDQSESAKTEIMLLVYGFSGFDDFVQNLINEGGITEENAFAIAKESDAKIFGPIARRVEELEIKVRPTGPIIITQETKKDVIKELAQRVQMAKQEGGQIKPRAIFNSLPAVERGEVTHTVPPMSEKEKVEIKTEQDKRIPIVPSTAPVPQPAPTAVVMEANKIPIKVKTENKPSPAPAPHSIPKPLLQNQPTAKIGQSPVKPTNPHYAGGADPYREPIE